MVDFNTIPSNLRIPGVYQEVDSTSAAGGASLKKTLIVGQQTSADITEGTPTQITSAGAAADTFGSGSMIHRMAIGHFANDPFADTWVIPLDDAGGAADAAGTLTVTGPATEAGTLYIYVGGSLVTVAVSNGDAQNTIAAAIEAAIDADLTLPVTAGSATNVVTVTAKNGGTRGNLIDVQLNFMGPEGGEETPDGVGVAVVAMSGGATDPTMSTAIDAMGEDRYYSILWPYPDDTPLNTLGAELNDSTTGRWGPTRQLWGRAWCAFEAANQSAVTTHTNGRNDQHVHIFGYTGIPTWEPEAAAAFGSACTRKLKLDPAAPIQYTPVYGVKAPPRLSRYTATERNILLFDGCATFIVGASDVVQIERAVTTYQLDLAGNPDSSYLDAQTLATLEAILDDVKTSTQAAFPAYKLADDGFPVKPGQNVITPSIFKGFIVGRYRTWLANGWVENVDEFAKLLTVTRNADVNRLDMLLPPDLMNQFRLLASRLAFFLNYPASS